MLKQDFLFNFANVWQKAEIIKIIEYMEIKERLSALRSAMKKNAVAAYIIPGTDPHASEYIADHWKEREWISGFNGSAGTVVVTLDGAGLWTDSRYFLQATEQLNGSGIELMKQGVPETPEIVPWLTATLKAGDKVGVNPQMFSLNAYASMKAELAVCKIELVSIDLLSDIWTDRPELPKSKLFIFDEKYAGISVKEKLDRLRNELRNNHADVFIMSALDDIAWLFNVRGKDVNYNPVVIAYALVDEKNATLFIDADKVNEADRKALQQQGVCLAAYDAVLEAIRTLQPDASVLVDGGKLNQSLFEAIPAGCTIRNTMSPVFKMKSIKNAVELEGIRRAMVKDGIALVRFFKWLEENVRTGNLSEISVSDKLYEFRSKQERFMGESFNTIAGYAHHGAIVHYSATPESDSKLHAENLLLLDSGGQYLDGTTDITRTVALGTPTVQQVIDFTRVLKGHISLATAIFPVGTRGSQLDILARKSLWDECQNYGHGTGHGVGHFLNVHEGPQNIRMDENPVTLQPGMIISNEPGLYRTNEYGIRTENLIHVVCADKTEFGQFLKFETLTLFPIDQTLIDPELLDNKEIEWLNEYHLRVYNTLSKGLNEDEREWLARKCTPIKVQR